MFVYVLIALLGVSAGVMFGVQIRAPFRWAGVVAGLLIVGVAVGVGSIFGSEALWSGPLFAIIAPVTAVLVAAEARRDERLFLPEPYWRRVLLVLSPRSARETASSE